jgi:hypothetical protein
MIHTRIKKVLKHTFIPHHENNYLPHIFREHVLLSVFIMSMLLLLVSFTSYIVIRTTTFGSSVVSSVLIDLTNQTRKEHGLSPLLYNQQLFTAAAMKGEDMVTRNYFAHFAPDGTSPWHWFNEAKYPFLFAGENLAINYRSSTAVEKAWMNSPKHRENILDTRYEDIGIATIPGTVHGKPVLFVVQLFGTQEPTLTPPSLLPRNILPSVHFYEKLLFNLSYYVNNIYTTLISLLVMALCCMIFIEIRKQHLLHVFYGGLLIVVVLVCLGVNASLV